MVGGDQKPIFFCKILVLFCPNLLEGGVGAGGQVGGGKICTEKSILTAPL